MSNQYKTKEFKDLQDKWYDKLKKKGFEDIEQADGNLKRWDSHLFSSKYDQRFFNSKEKYFQIAGQFLHEYEFETKLDAFIWGHHAAGETLWSIVAKIKGRKFKPIQKDTVRKIILLLEKEMLTKYANSDED